MLVAFALAGCATVQPPRAWEKATLAQPQMQLDADPLDSKLKQHIYTSKEAASRLRSTLCAVGLSTSISGPRGAARAAAPFHG